jgi:hypothetical protein
MGHLVDLRLQLTVHVGGERPVAKRTAIILRVVARVRIPPEADQVRPRLPLGAYSKPEGPPGLAQSNQLGGVMLTLAWVKVMLPLPPPASTRIFVSFIKPRFMPILCHCRKCSETDTWPH